MPDTRSTTNTTTTTDSDAKKGWLCILLLAICITLVITWITGGIEEIRAFIDSVIGIIKVSAVFAILPIMYVLVASE